MLALGIVIGVLLSILVAILNLRFSDAVARTVQQVESSLKVKGKLLEPSEDTITNWIDELPNDYGTPPEK